VAFSPTLAGRAGPDARGGPPTARSDHTIAGSIKLDHEETRL
jgi:hypothetical protein